MLTREPNDLLYRELWITFHEQLIQTIRSLKSPCLVTEEWEYDNQGFRQFPARKGINIYLLKQGNFQGHAWEDILSFLQSWLFFGLILDIFKTVGLSLTANDFIRSSATDSRTVTTELWPQLVVAWEMIERAATEGSKREHLKHVDACLSSAQDFIHNNVIVQWADDRFADKSLRDIDDENFLTHTLRNLPDGDQVLLSILILSDALLHARLIAYNNDNHREPSPIGDGETFGFWRRHRLIDCLLLKQGWCPFEVETSRLQSSNSARLYFSSFNRPREPENHSKCTAINCIWNAVDRDAYKSRHTTSGCTCPHLHAISSPEREGSIGSGDMVQSTLEQGHTPLAVVLGPEGEEQLSMISSREGSFIAAMRHAYLKFERETGSSWAVKNVGSKAVVRYVAVSHVWRGGLGNPQQNTLPRCQLVRIQNLVNALHDKSCHPVPFWIDTLCVPLESTFRALAIQQMKGVYQEADKVLVLDSGLQTVLLSSDPVHDLMRIHCSTWMQRLWTFQEGLLAADLVFQFRGISVRGEDLTRKSDSNDREWFNKHRADILNMIRAKNGCVKSALIRSRNKLGIHGKISVDDPWTGRGWRFPTHEMSLH